MKKLVRLAKALGHPTLVRIVLALRQSELCVCELADALEIRQSTLSTRLQALREAELVHTRKEGKWVYYVLNPRFRSWFDEMCLQFQEELQSDPRLQRDTERISRRLQLRENGCCVIGFNQLDIASRGGEK